MLGIGCAGLKLKVALALVAWDDQGCPALEDHLEEGLASLEEDLDALAGLALAALDIPEADLFAFLEASALDLPSFVILWEVDLALLDCSQEVVKRILTLLQCH